jgi:hypothetical protein
MTSYPEDVGIEMLRNYCLFYVRICRMREEVVVSNHALTTAICRSMVWLTFHMLNGTGLKSDTTVSNHCKHATGFPV